MPEWRAAPEVRTQMDWVTGALLVAAFAREWVTTESGRFVINYGLGARISRELDSDLFAWGGRTAVREYRAAVKRALLDILQSADRRRFGREPQEAVRLVDSRELAPPPACLRCGKRWPNHDNGGYCSPCEIAIQTSGTEVVA